MVPVYSLLAVNMQQVEKAVLLLCATILLIAFFVGFKRGFRQVGWKGVLCLTSFELFLLLDGALKEKGLILKGMSNFGISGEAMTSLIVACVCCLLFMSVYALCWVTFRPKYKWVTTNPTYSENEFEYEDDSLEYETGERQRRIIWKNAGTPTVFGRYIGAIVCALNIFSIMLFVACSLLLLLGNTSLMQNETVFAFLHQGFISQLYEYASVNGMDYIFICILLTIAHKGYENGLVASLFNFFTSMGTLLVAGVAFYLPFLPTVRENATLAGVFGIVDGLVAKIPLIGSMLESNPSVGQSISNVLVGLVLFAIFSVLLSFLKNVLRKSGKAIRQNKSMRRMDGLLSAILYFILGIVVCILIWGVVYALVTLLGDKNILNMSFMDDTKFVNAFYGLAEKFLAPLLTK